MVRFVQEEDGNPQHMIFRLFMIADAYIHL